MLAGCWRSAPPPPPTTEPGPPRVERDAALEDEPELPPVDAAVDAAPDAAPRVFCAGGIRARVIGVSVVGSATQTTVAEGSGSGVAATWTARFEQGSLSRIPMRIIRVDQRITIVETTATPDQIRASSSLTVRLCPP